MSRRQFHGFLTALIWSLMRVVGDKRICFLSTHLFYFNISSVQACCTHFPSAVMIRLAQGLISEAVTFINELWSGWTMLILLSVLKNSKLKIWRQPATLLTGHPKVRRSLCTTHPLAAHPCMSDGSASTAEFTVNPTRDCVSSHIQTLTMIWKCFSD